MVTEEGGSQVFYGVQCTLSESRFAVGLFHADVEGGYDFVAYLVLAGNINAAQQTDVVNGKAGDGFHELWVLSYEL